MSRRYCRNSLVIIAAFFLLAAASGGHKGEKEEREPIVITSNHMEADRLGDKVTFTGNVNLKQENMTMTTDTMIVYYDEGTKDIREIEAHGNVVVHKDDRVALSNDATYYNREEKIILTGDARIIENDNQIGGQKITMYLRDDRSYVEGGKVLLYQDQQDKFPGGVKRK